MHTVKKYLGLLWMVLGPAFIVFLVYGAIINIDSEGTKDINNPVIWVIIIAIFTPIAIGLSLFGYYAFTNEYTKDVKSSEDL
jgi:hypothetical protein